MPQQSEQTFFACVIRFWSALSDELAFILYTVQLLHTSTEENTFPLQTLLLSSQKRISMVSIMEKLAIVLKMRI